MAMLNAFDISLFKMLDTSKSNVKSFLSLEVVKVKTTNFQLKIYLKFKEF